MRERLGQKNSYPLVSVLVRTCSRPEALRRALDSVRRQTYPNLEVVVVEDGVNTAEEMLKEEYADLTYVYEATGRHVGRSKAGNRAMQLSTGKYLNFLDDDDVLYPCHVTALVHGLKGKTQKAAYSVAQEREAEDKEGMRSRASKNTVRYRQPFNRLLLYTKNYIPIQSILFERSLYEALGGLDEDIDALEDWDLWVRYSTATDFLFIDQVTSYYHVPRLKKTKKKRAADLKKDLGKLHRKFQEYRTELTVEDINRDMLYVLRQYKENEIVRCLRMFFRAVLFGER